jgi:HD-GYP domain-containing protein (c-di-GMP phosphodiesterase class II)
VTADYDRLTRGAVGKAPLAARAAAQALEEVRDGAYDPVVVDLLLSVLRLDGRSDTTPLGALEFKRTRTPAA